MQFRKLKSRILVPPWRLHTPLNMNLYRLMKHVHELRETGVSKQRLKDGRGERSYWRARKMSWILPSISSSSGLMGRSLVIPHARNQNPAAETSPIFRLLQSPPQSAALPGIKPTDPPTSREGSEERVRIQHTRSKSPLDQRQRGCFRGLSLLSNPQIKSNSSHRGNE